MKRKIWQTLLIMLWVSIFIFEAWFFQGYMGDELRTAAEESEAEALASKESVELSFFCKDIYIDGVLIRNYELIHPILFGGGEYWFPATPLWKLRLGFETDIDRTDMIFLLEDRVSYPGSISDGQLAINDFSMRYNAELHSGFRLMSAENLYAQRSKTRLLMDLEAEDFRRFNLYSDKFPEFFEGLNQFCAEFPLAKKALGVLGIPPSLERELIAEHASYVKIDGCIYLPLSWFEYSEDFGWSSHYDELTGLYISTDPARRASSWFSEQNASFIAGCAEYMRAWNRELSFEDAVYFEYLFRHESTVYDIPQTFLMAVCRGEGMFRPEVIGGSAIGMMQIMPRTGEAQGYSREMLLDPHYNIEFGAMYIRNFMRRYSGDIIKTMSAYNQGSGTVSSGSYRTDYAYRILWHEENIIEWLRSRGYATEFAQDLR